MKRLIFLILIAGVAFSQSFTPNVEITGQNMNPQEERILDDLRNMIEQYILSNSFSNEQYDLYVPFRISTTIGISSTPKVRISTGR